MQRRSSPRRPVQPFVPAPPPGVGASRPDAPPAGGRARQDAPSGLRALPPLPKNTFGIAPRRSPGAMRPAPKLGGISGVAVPPEIRRRVKGAVRAAPGAAQAADQIRAALRKAQVKLLGSQQKLQGSVAALRALLKSRT